jgi:hypothetical protein
MPSLENSKRKKWTTAFRNNPEKLGHAIGYDRLTVDHGNWIKYIWGPNPDASERAIQAHRNSYKTTSIVVLGVIWYILFNPQHTVLIVREEMSNAIATLQEIADKYKHRNLQAIYNEFFDLFPLVLKRETQKSIILPNKRDIGREGNIDAAGLGTSKTGRHYNRIHTDDIMTLKDRVSKAKRDKAKEELRELRNIKMLQTGVITHTGTPWHRDDAWTIIPNIKKFPIGTVNIPEIMKDLNKAKNDFREGTTSSLYACNYDLKHVANEDSLFQNAKWLNDIPENYEPVGHIDAGYKGKNTTALTLIQEIGVKLILTGFIWDKNIMENMGVIRNKIQDNRWKIGSIHMEDNADKGFTARDVREFHASVVEYHESMNKHIKIVTFLVKHWKNVYFTPATDPEYVNQILDYVETQEPDDAPDSAASLLRKLKGSGKIIETTHGSGDFDYINEDRY